MRGTSSRTFERSARWLALFAASGVASAAWADNVAVIDLTGVLIRHATNQSRSSAPDAIDPHYAYAYEIKGKARGSGVILGALFPSPTDLATVLETLSPGSSEFLQGQACNPDGTHPIQASDVSFSTEQIILGITVTFSATVSVGIDANNHAYFSLTNVVLSPSVLVGSLTITEGDVTLIGLCTADFDESGFVDTDDFDAFVAAFEAGDDIADIDCSGFVDTDDFDTFVRRFEDGC